MVGENDSLKDLMVRKIDGQENKMVRKIRWLEQADGWKEQLVMSDKIVEYFLIGKTTGCIKKTGTI